VLKLFLNILSSLIFLRSLAASLIYVLFDRWSSSFCSNRLLIEFRLLIELGVKFSILNSFLALDLDKERDVLKGLVCLKFHD
jgi:hypothetical protein